MLGAVSWWCMSAQWRRTDYAAVDRSSWARGCVIVSAPGPPSSCVPLRPAQPHPPTQSSSRPDDSGGPAPPLRPAAHTSPHLYVTVLPVRPMRPRNRQSCERRPSSEQQQTNADQTGHGQFGLNGATRVVTCPPKLAYTQGGSNHSTRQQQSARAPRTCSHHHRRQAPRVWHGLCTVRWGL